MSRLISELSCSPSSWRIERQYTDAEEERQSVRVRKTGARVQTVGACRKSANGFLV